MGERGLGPYASESEGIAVRGDAFCRGGTGMSFAELQLSVESAQCRALLGRTDGGVRPYVVCWCCPFIARDSPRDF